jgi:ATP-dependent 26S proteasome regulatory subunit
MSSTTGKFDHRLANRLKAKFPILYLPTWEEDRVISAIRRVVENEELIRTRRKLFTWSLTTGLIMDGQAPNEESKAPLNALERVEKFHEPAVFVFKDFHVFFGESTRPADPHVVRRVRDVVPALTSGSCAKSLIFVSPSLVLPLELQKHVTVVDFELPSFDDIMNKLQEMVETHRPSGLPIDLQDTDYEHLAKAALGLTMDEAENAIALAMAEDGRLDVHDVEVILGEKQQIIRKTGILEFINTDLTIADVGGLENLKRWLNKRDKSWLDEARRYCLPAPKGVLLTGVPGCGKSLVAKAISAKWQLPLLRLDVGRIFSGLVGSSEQNIRTAIGIAEAVAPAILWIDEIEKGFSGTTSTGDTGVSARVFGTFLTWMQEKTKAVFVIATANNIQSLPPEMLRKGRFDEIFFVDLPTRTERVDIFNLHISKRLKDKDVIGDFQQDAAFLETVTTMTEGFSGAEIECVVIDALFEAFSENRSIRSEDFVRAIKNTEPLSVTQAEQIRKIRQWADQRAVAATRQEDRVDYGQVDPEDETADVRYARGGRTVDF